jgi:hypothetical protein
MEAAISAAIAAARAAAARLSFFINLKWENRNAPGRHVIVRELFYWGTYFEQGRVLSARLRRVARFTISFGQ